MKSLPIRPLIGFSAAFATMATVAVAGMTAPGAETTLHASAGCKNEKALPKLEPGYIGAERPA